MSLKAYKREIFIFYFVLISCYSAQFATKPQLQKQHQYSNEEPIRLSSGQIRVTVDNVLEKITINGNPLSLNSIGDLTDWTKTKTINVISLNPGDIIAITGSNSGVYSKSNPGAILATITYYNSNGVQKQFSTGNGWRCDGKKARRLGANGQTNTIWYKVRPGKVPNISSSAEWIWYRRRNRQQTTCSVIVPK